MFRRLCYDDFFYIFWTKSAIVKQLKSIPPIHFPIEILCRTYPSYFWNRSDGWCQIRRPLFLSVGARKWREEVVHRRSSDILLSSPRYCCWALYFFLCDGASRFHCVWCIYNDACLHSSEIIQAYFYSVSSLKPKFLKKSYFIRF